MDKNLALLTDFYELTMMNGYLQNGMADKIAVFDLFFRQGRESTFCIACGLEQAIDYVKNISFGNDEIEYLRSLGTFGEDFLQRLKNFKFSGSIKAIPEAVGSGVAEYRKFSNSYSNKIGKSSQVCKGQRCFGIRPAPRASAGRGNLRRKGCNYRRLRSNQQRVGVSDVRHRP